MAFKNRNPPHYPVEAIEKGAQGEVILEVTIDAGGRVTEVAVDPEMTTAPAVLQTAAIQAAVNWKFKPGIENGHLVGGGMKIPVRFSLEGLESQAKLPCPPGFEYQQGNKKSYTCSAQSSAPAPPD